MLLLHVFFQIRFHFTKISAKNTSLSNINHSIAIKVLISNKHYSQEQNSTSHETFMASSEVILKVTKTRKSVLHPSQGRTYKCFMHTVVVWIPLLGVIDFVATFLAFKIHSCSYTYHIDRDLNFSLHANFLSASLGSNSCRHIFTCYTLKQRQRKIWSGLIWYFASLEQNLLL